MYMYVSSPPCLPQFQVNLAKSQAPGSLPVARTTTESSVTDIDAALTNLQVCVCMQCTCVCT